MILLISRLKAKSGYENTLIKGCMKLAEVVREKERECLMYKPYASIESINEVIIIEKYLSEKALDYHMRTRHYIDAMGEFKNILEAPIDVQRFYEEPVTNVQ